MPINPAYRQAEFLTAAMQLSQCPPEDGVEVAFAGRSNAGKSSALNCITQRRKLARTSRTPGRTQMINFFRLDDRRRLVDLPGYGYAKVPESMQKHWRRGLQEYVLSRRSLAGLVLVLDIRQGITELDWLMIDHSARAGVPLHCLLTKADKLSRNQVRAALDKARRELEDAGIEASLQDFSASKSSGVEDAHQVLDEWFEYVDSATPTD